MPAVSHLVPRWCGNNGVLAPVPARAALEAPAYPGERTACRSRLPLRPGQRLTRPGRHRHAHAPGEQIAAVTAFLTAHVLEPPYSEAWAAGKEMFACFELPANGS